MRSNANVISAALTSQSVHPNDIFDPAELDGVNSHPMEIEPPTKPDDPATLECYCGILCHKKTVLKEGPTKGRIFFGCQRQVCDFFAWGSPTENVRTLPTRNASRDKNSSPANNIKCLCGLIAIESTVRGGENANRRYMHCSKSYKTCNFFEWIDDNRGRAPSRGTTSGNRSCGQWRGSRQT